MLIVMIRTLILYLLVIFALRLMGKKQLGELQPTELVTTILISNIATLSIEDPSLPMLVGIVPILMIVCIDVFMSGVMLKWERIRRLVTGSPRIIISDGKIDQNEMKNLRYTIDDVMEAMRECMIFDISNVQYAIVETTGKINFFPKEEGTDDPPSLLIKDGVINRDGLTESGLGDSFLERALSENKTDKSRVFLLTADKKGKYTLILKDHK